MSTCIECGKTRTDETDYDPFALFRGSDNPGWYSGDDGEICGPCMGGIFRKANGR